MNSIRPTAINVHKQAGYLEISWNDGTTCRYPVSQLREACPCVECRGGHARMGREFDPDSILTLTPKRSYTLTNIAMVGQYALQPTWDDGHDTGMYTFEYLHRLCPHEQE